MKKNCILQGMFILWAMCSYGQQYTVEELLPSKRFEAFENSDSAKKATNWKSIEGAFNHVKSMDSVTAKTYLDSLRRGWNLQLLEKPTQKAEATLDSISSIVRLSDTQKAQIKWDKKGLNTSNFNQYRTYLLYEAAKIQLGTLQLKEKQSPPQPSLWKDWGFWGMVGALVLMIVLLSWLLSLQTNMRKLKTTLESTSTLATQLEKDLELLKKAFEKKPEETTLVETKEPALPKPTNNRNPTVRKTEKSYHYWYVGGVTPTGIFMEIHKMPVKNVTFFQIEVEDGIFSRGKFQIIEDDSVLKTVLYNPSNYLPHCAVVHGSGRTLQSFTAGEVELIGNTWKVSEKMIVHLQK